jgi:hypothetical protein
LAARFVSADVIINVQYRLAIDLPYCPFRMPFIDKESEKRLITAPTSDGKLKWLPYGVRDQPVPPPHIKMENVPGPYDLPQKRFKICG